MRIAVLVHSAVRNDARISKEAMSLRAAGHEVVIHGIAPDAQRHREVLPGSDVPLWLEPRVSGVTRWRKRGLLLLVILMVTVLVVATARLFAVDVPALSWQYLALFALAGGGLAAAAAWYARHRLSRIAQHLDDFVSSRWRQVFGSETSPALDIGLPLARGYHDIARALLRSVAQGPPPEVIHIHDHVALVLAATLKQRYGVPIVWDAHEIYQELAGGDAARAAEHAAIIAACQRHIDHFITINASIARFYAEHYPALPPAVLVMNATLPETVPVYDGRLHQAAGVAATQKILLFQGRFSAHRGLEQLVAAAALLRTDWTLVMMGWGGLETSLRAVASQHLRDGAPATVFLPGVPQRELQQWSAGASLGVVPYENTSLNHLYCTPNKLWEYPGAGVPILCTDLPEMAAMVGAFGFGSLLPRSFTAADIAAVVNALDDNTLARLRAACAPFIASNNWQRWERALLDIYRAIDGQRAVQ